MRKRIFASFVLLALAGMGIGLVLVFHRPLAPRFFEFVLNQTTADFFAGSIRIGDVQWRPNGGVRLEDFKGKLQSPRGPVPLQIQSIESRNSLVRYFSEEGLVLDFEGAQLADSKGKGIRGISILRGGGRGFFELQADVQGLDLKELVWINPENLEGSSGEMKGKIILRQDSKGAILLNGKLQVNEGGELPSHFFRLLKPYLPQIALSRKIKRIEATGGLVGFRLASLEMEMVESNKMKIVLHLAVPDYNLDLHLKVEVRLGD